MQKRSIDFRPRVAASTDRDARGKGEANDRPARPAKRTQSRSQGDRQNEANDVPPLLAIPDLINPPRKIEPNRHPLQNEANSPPPPNCTRPDRDQLDRPRSGHRRVLNEAVQ